MNLQPYIERIREELWQARQRYGLSSGVPRFNREDAVSRNIEAKATNAILAVMADMLEEMVGEDEHITEWSGNSRLDQQVKAEIVGANVLRADIKAEIATLRKEIQK